MDVKVNCIGSGTDYFVAQKKSGEGIIRLKNPVKKTWSKIGWLLDRFFCGEKNP